MPDDEPYEDWEIPEQRLFLSPELQRALSSSTTIVGISRKKLSQLHIDHAADAGYFDRMAEIVNGYEYWGYSRKRADAIELYKRLNGIWFTLVLYPPGPNTRLNSLGTMHRIDQRKVESRIRKYLQQRDKGK